MARKLRIAVSVFFGVVTVALCVLWVRSYWQVDFLTRYTPMYQGIISNRSLCQIQFNLHPYPGAVRTPWQLDSVSADMLPNLRPNSWAIWRPKIVRGSNMAVITMPYSWITLLFAAFSSLPLIPFRFSLRTLLIATTLFAIVLGLGAWLAS
jgi:hypothetical protein